MFVLLVVAAVLLVVSVLLVVAVDRLLQAARRGRHRAGPDRAGAPEAPPRPADPAPRPARRRSDGPPAGAAPVSGPGLPGPPPRPQPGPPVPPRPGADPPNAGEPTPPAPESRPRRAPEREEPPATRRPRARRAAPERLHLARIEPSTRQRYAQTFQRTSARFAEEPATALSDADKLVTLLMDERGLPVSPGGDDLSAEGARANLVGDYLAAHAIAEASRSQQVSREELEAGMARYQRLVVALLDDGEEAGAGAAPRA